MDTTELDFIGDVHGKASQLQALLYKLGYRQVDGGWKHRKRKVVFCGDLVDRGDEQFATLQVVKTMVDRGDALAVLGNHEHSAVGWALSKAQGEFCREHNEANRKQHKAFLKEGQEQPQQYRQWIEWLKTLPLCWEGPGVRVAHACWHEPSINVAKSRLGEGFKLDSQAWLDSFEKGSDFGKACALLLTGPEAPLAPEMVYQDHSGKTRKSVRVTWWKKKLTFAEAALPMPGLDKTALTDELLVPNATIELDPSQAYFVGHYWLHDRVRPLASNLACLDYSGQRHCPLTAYRWDGTPVLRSERFVQA